MLLPSLCLAFILAGMQSKYILYIFYNFSSSGPSNAILYQPGNPHWIENLGSQVNRVNYINLKIWTFWWSAPCRMMALQILQISKCYTMWPKLTQCYNEQDVGSAQSGNNLLGLIKAAHSQVSWADFCKMKMICLRNQKAECRTHHSIHSLPTTAGALGQQLPGCLSQATAKFKGVMYD